MGGKYISSSTSLWVCQHKISIICGSASLHHNDILGIFWFLYSERARCGTVTHKGIHVHAQEKKEIKHVCIIQQFTVSPSNPTRSINASANVSSSSSL